MSLALEEPKSKDDVRVVNGINLAIEPIVVQFVEHVTLDVRDTPNGKGLVMRNAPGGAC
ncbi:hypothetical protein LC040_08100 [Bacillus tianshenii]|nr:hypothetical protein LC040_08100 [Bacillus tianshenii]